MGAVGTWTCAANKLPPPASPHTRRPVIVAPPLVLPSGASVSHCGMLFHVAEQVPLTTLLAFVWTAFTIEVDNAVEAVGSEHLSRLFGVSIAMWANGLRFIGEEGVTVDELHALARARCNIGGLERWGWISVGDVGAGRREGYGSHRGVKGATVLRPTRAGSYARRLWPRMIATVEERWQERFGREVIGSLRGASVPLTGAMPWAPPEVHPSDGFYTHVIEGSVAHENPPLVALMGQALTALTLRQEKDAEVSLPIAADFLRVIGSRAVRTRDLPSSAGVSKEAVAMAINFLKARHFAELVPAGSVKLTATGLDALDGFRARAARTKDETLQAALVALVSRARGVGRRARAPRGLLAWCQTLSRSDPTPVGRPDRGAALAPDGPAPRRMARRLLSP